MTVADKLLELKAMIEAFTSHLGASTHEGQQEIGQNEQDTLVGKMNETIQYMSPPELPVPVEGPPAVDLDPMPAPPTAGAPSGIIRE